MANQDLNRREMIAALEWYSAIGVDLAVAETPIDRFAETARKSTLSARAPDRVQAPQLPGGRVPSASPVPAQRAPAIPAVGGPTDADPQTARELAAKAQSLDELRGLLETFDGCLLKLRATNLVFADGNPDANIMFVGEAPGRDEDLQGKPFVGRSGQLLDRMLGAIGLDRTSVYIANTVPWRPPGNRTPSPSEVAVCLPFLYRQIELVAPKVLVALGGASAKILFDTDTGITRLRGQWRELTVTGHSMRAMATLHPAYLLRQPAAKKLAWHDMLAIKKGLAG